MMILEETKKATAGKVMKEALKESGLKQTDIAETLHINQASVSSNINRKKVGIDVFITMIETMGYTVCVGKKENSVFTPIWELEKEDE